MPSSVNLIIRVDNIGPYVDERAVCVRLAGTVDCGPSDSSDTVRCSSVVPLVRGRQTRVNDVVY